MASFSQGEKMDVPTTRILLIFDASKSMLDTWEGDQRINIARNLLISMVDSLEKVDNVQLAMRVYGHQKNYPPKQCDDTRLEVPFGSGSASKIRQKLKFISPKGTTPIAHSLNLCAQDFPPCDNCRNVVILITDGIEECDGDPCEVSSRLQDQGIILKPFVIGVGLDIEFKKTFECVGTFFNAKSSDEFSNILNIVISQVLNPTSVQVNLLDIEGEPTESNVNMSFYDLSNNKLVYNYMHTINNRGIPDTISLDPLRNYRMKAHTLPPVYIDTIEPVPGKYTIVATDAPQGYLNLQCGAKSNPRSVTYIVRQKGKMETVNVQYTNDPEKYIVGLYDLEILTLPRIYLYNVEIKQSHTTNVEIPVPGLLNLSKNAEGYGSIYYENNNDLEWVCNIDSEGAVESFSLQPGNYRLVWRGKHKRQSIYTFQKKFTINSGASKALTVY